MTKKTRVEKVTSSVVFMNISPSFISKLFAFNPFKTNFFFVLEEEDDDDDEEEQGEDEEGGRSIIF